MHIRHYETSDAGPIAGLQGDYGRAFPGATVQDADYIRGLYGHPAFAGGRNIFCAYDAAERLLGYAFIFVKAPAGTGRDLYVEVKARPDLPNAGEVRDRLFDAILARAQETARAEPQWSARLQAVCFAFETDAIRHYQAKGLAHYESGYMMGRSLAEPVPDLPAPAGVEVRAWRMESEAEQLRYLAAHNAALQDYPWDLGMLRYFMGSPMWAVGTSFTAFAGDEIAGSLLAYWNEGENQRSGQLVGSTEEIFVLPPWRGRGIARCLIARGLRFLREQGLAEARLEMASTNAAALALYRSMGYRVLHEQLFLAKEITGN